MLPGYVAPPPPSAPWHATHDSANNSAPDGEPDSSVHLSEEEEDKSRGPPGSEITPVQDATSAHAAIDTLKTSGILLIGFQSVLAFNTRSPCKLFSP
jgi:hypothetical protein